MTDSDAELDDDGYPTEAALEKIRHWKIDSHVALAALWEFTRSLWIYPDYFWQEDGQWHVSTGGWSGHEDVIGSLQKNWLFWSLCWQQHRRGGHYIFDLRRESLGCVLPDHKIS